MFNGQQRGDRNANNNLNNPEVLFRKHGEWVWYKEGDYPIYVPINFLFGLKNDQELQEKLKREYCGSGEMADTPT